MPIRSFPEKGREVVSRRKKTDLTTVIDCNYFDYFIKQNNLYFSFLAFPFFSFFFSFSFFLLKY